MTDTVMTTAAEPDGAPRMASLDILRGIAILGILFMNINHMGGSMFASFGDIRHLGWSEQDQAAWWVREVFWVGTARCMLEMLFGVGMVILTERAAKAMEGSEKVRRGFSAALHAVFGEGAIMRGYYVRNIVLFLFGLVHIFILLWPGDILHTYGLAALVAFLFRRLSWRWLLGVGLTLATLQLCLGSFFIHQARSGFEVYQRQQAGATLTAEEKKQVEWVTKRIADNKKNKAEDAARIAAEDKERTSGAYGWAHSAWTTILFLEAQFLELAWIWEAAGTMLVGAALYKLGVIQGRRSWRFYLITAVIALGFGITSRALTANHDMIFVTPKPPVYGYAMGEYARLAMTLGYICLVQLIVGSGLRLILKPFEAAGRVALSIYIAQTITCIWVLYPPFALALYGKQGWFELMVTAAAVNASLLVLANLYVLAFRIGPVEWAWRSILAGRALPILKARKAAARAG